MWTKEKPCNPGYYWFYGDPGCNRMTCQMNRFNSKIIVIKVLDDDNRTVVGDGMFLYDCDLNGLFWDERIAVPKTDSLEYNEFGFVEK